MNSRPLSSMDRISPSEGGGAGSIPAGGTREEWSKSFGSPRGVYAERKRSARRPNRMEFSGQKEISDSVRSRK